MIKNQKERSNVYFLLEYRVMLREKTPEYEVLPTVQGKRVEKGYHSVAAGALEDHGILPASTRKPMGVTER